MKSQTTSSSFQAKLNVRLLTSNVIFQTMMIFVLFLLICTLPFSFCQLFADENLNVTGEAYVAELTKLEKDLLKNYSKSIRPVKNANFKINLLFFPVIDHIQELDEKQGKIVVKGALYLEWVDYFMSWNRADYSNVSRLIMYPYLLWKPDLLVYNAADNASAPTLSYWTSHIWLYSNGRAIWYPSFSFHASCNLDFSNFPYDQHGCPIIIGPWSYNSRELEFTLVSDKPEVWMTFNDTKSVVAGWQLVDFKQRLTWWDAYNQTFVFFKPAENDIGYYFPCVEVTPILKRHLPYFAVTALLPSIASSVLTVLSFCINNLRNRAGVLAINLILQIIFSDDLLRILPPTTNNVPNIVQYFACNLILTLLAIMMFVVMESMKYWNTSTTPIPRCLSIFVYIWSSRKTALKSKCHFRSDPKKNVATEEETNEEVATTAASTSQLTSNETWLTVVECLTDLFFFIYIIFYFIFMLLFLC